MKTIVLPGLSKRNEDWLIGINDNLKLPSRIYLHRWATWFKQKEFDIDLETQKILGVISNDDKVNFIAKSIGTKVLVKLIPQLRDRVNKIILCGIPVDPVNYLTGLKTIKPQNLLIIQNSQDPYMPYWIIEKYIHLIDKTITVVEKESDNHDYPYFEEFEYWLS